MMGHLMCMDWENWRMEFLPFAADFADWTQIFGKEREVVFICEFPGKPPRLYILINARRFNPSDIGM
jgi:hypothetical protein